MFIEILVYCVVGFGFLILGIVLAVRKVLSGHMEGDYYER